MCQISGQKDIKLVVHHLNAWGSSPDERFDIHNGITISEELHKLFHKYYGRGNNTKEQFDEFLTWVGLTLIQ